MTPTPKLRFVDRKMFIEDALPPVITKRILQQWWTKYEPDDDLPDWWGYVGAGEWRDVPLEEET